MTLRTLLDRFDLLMDTPKSVPKLRRFILQLAVRGRITDRRSSDTPAKELLEPIQSEKKRLYDDGTIRKSQAKLPELAENGESLPDGWVSIELERVGVVNPRHDADEDTKASFVPMKRIEDGVGDGHTTEVRPWGEIRRGYTHFMEGDVGLAKITPCFQNRKSTVFRDLQNGMGAGTTELYVFRPLAGTILPEFVLSFFQSQGFIAEGVSRMTGTAGQKRVPREYVEQSLLPLPPLEEQQRIIETVDGLMDECDALEQQQERERILQVQVGTAATEALQSADDTEALRPAWERVHEHFDTVTATPEGVDALRQTILQLAVQGRLTERTPDDTPADVLLEQIQQEKQRLYDAGEIRKPKNGSDIEDQELPFDLPPSWRWVRLTDAVQRAVDCLHKTAPFEEEDTGYYCVDTTCINETEIEFENLRPVSAETYEEWTRRMVPQGGDILFSREGNIGLTAIVPEDVKLCLGQRMMIFRLPDELLPRYFHLVLQSPVITKQRKPEVMGTAATRINISTIRDFLVPFPPVKEQARITGTVDEILPTCDDLKTKTVQAMERGEDTLQAVLHSLSTSTDRGTVEA